MKKNIIGQKFNRLVALKFSYMKKYRPFWLFKCECGIIKILRMDFVISGYTKSCGCLWKERIKKANTTHGHTIKGVSTRFYYIWRSMKKRIFCQKDISFLKYGGRGIRICKRWLKFENFRDDMYESYLAHVKEFGEKQTTIDRINNNGNYKLSNCKWATYKEQCRNRSNNHYLTKNGKTMILKDWAEKLEISETCILNRISRGMTMAEVLTKIK